MLQIKDGPDYLRRKTGYGQDGGLYGEAKAAYEETGDGKGDGWDEDGDEVGEGRGGRR